jgi:hypothetical protein
VGALKWARFSLVDPWTCRLPNCSTSETLFLSWSFCHRI